MSTLLIVYHTRTGGSRQMAESAADAAREHAPALVMTADQAGPADLLKAGGYLFCEPENLAGHKLITGYPEGRRMWLHVVARDGDDATVFESGAYDVDTAIDLARSLGPHDIGWLEEPINPDNPAALAKVRAASPVPIGAGESEFNQQAFAALVDAAGAVEVPAGEA